MNYQKLKLSELNRLDKKDFTNSCKSDIYVILDDIRSGLNIGSIFRTCDAFRVNKIYITGISPVPPHKEIIKTALGSTETVEWQYIKNIYNLLNELKDANIKVFAVEQTLESTMLDKFNIGINEPIALIFGNEVEGVKQDIINLCNGVIEIPQFGTKHSLNVAVSAGIVLWQLVSKRTSKFNDR